MIDSTNIRDITRERIRERLELTGKSPRSVSLAVGKNASYLSQYLVGRQSGMDAGTLANIARELGTTVLYLQGSSGDPASAEVAPLRIERDVRPAPPTSVAIFGTAAGSTSTGALNMSTEIIDWLPCPPGLVNMRGVYALYMIGDSMAPRWRHADLVFATPNKPYRSGDDVVIQKRNGDEGETEAWVKEFVKETPEEIITLQHNPAQEKRFKRSEIASIHRIAAPNDLIAKR